MTYVLLTVALTNAMNNGSLDALEVGRRKKICEDDCRVLAGMPLDEATRRNRDPMTFFAGLMESGEEELRRVQEAYQHVDTLREEQKKKWDELIEATIELQRQAREDPAKGMVYVLRDADPSRAGKVLKLKWFHVRFFDVWNDTAHQNNLIMAQPGSGKTTCKLYEICKEIGEAPQLRHLILGCTDNRAADLSLAIQRMLRHARYRALYPHIRVLTRMEGHKQRANQFTVCRVNELVKEHTIEAAGIDCNVNGQGYDRVHADDIVHPDAQFYPHVRRTAIMAWNRVIERRLREPAFARLSMIATLWHEDDLHGTIRSDALAGRKPTWRIAVDEFVTQDDENGDPISMWPEKFSVEYLKEYRFKDPVGYALNFKMSAAEQKRRAVSRVHWYDSTSEPSRTRDREIRDKLTQCERWLSIDPAASAGAQSSETGAIEGLITPNGYGFISNAWYLRLEMPALLEWIVESIWHAWLAKRPYAVVALEAQAAMKAAVSTWVDIIPKMLAEKRTISNGRMPPGDVPMLMTPGVNIGGAGRMNISKWNRAVEASPYAESGMIRFAGACYYNHKTREWYYGPIPESPVARLVEMLKNFDGSNRFDAGDAWSQFVLMNKARLKTPFGVVTEMVAEELPVSRLNAAFRAQMKKQMAGEPDPDNEADFYENKYGQAVA